MVLMANVSINALYDKLLQVEKEVVELRHALIPVEKISAKEHDELDSIFKEMRRGKAAPWRQALRA
ncbi:MAG: hypothetical protein NTY90_05625 [Candidatus Micrarchaeota archaeon]|nr:hypothetical protein [Candidatus Micrarchaeota archaeon]